jgi:hypothetical protein
MRQRSERKPLRDCGKMRQGRERRTKILKDYEIAKGSNEMRD